MYIRKQKRKSGRAYLSVVQGYRTPEGKTRSRHVRSLGYLDELERRHADPIAHFQAEVDGEGGPHGLGKKGVSKEHRPEPTVRMGMLIDADGIPLDCELFPGNVNDMSSMVPMMDEEGYNESDSGRLKVKSRIADRAVYVTGEDKKRRKVIVPVKEVAFWSRGPFERGRCERVKVIEKTRAAIARGDMSGIVSRGSAKYAKDKPVVEETVEAASHNWAPDEARIEADAAMDGCCRIVTSEQEWTEREVIEAYRGLARIEDSFRVLKSTMDARPAHVWTREHIEAHFLICYAALASVRLMQLDVERVTGTRPSDGAVQEAFSNMVGHRLDRNVYFFDYRSDLTDALCEVVGIDLSREAMTKSQMNKVMSVVKRPRS